MLYWNRSQNFENQQGVMVSYSIYEVTTIILCQALGTFALKEECWEEFEGRNFFHYMQEDLQLAMQRFQVKSILYFIVFINFVLAIGLLQ
jgi:hypothetical protein